MRELGASANVEDNGYHGCKNRQDDHKHLDPFESGMMVVDEGN